MTCTRWPAAASCPSSASWSITPPSACASSCAGDTRPGCNWRRCGSAAIWPSSTRPTWPAPTTEADAYLAKLGLRVAAAERDELLRYTEGWMAGLRLAANATRRGSGTVGHVGSDPAAADYLRDEILDRQPAGIRQFLLRTSMAGRLTGEFADWLTGGSGGARVLDRLVRENSLVVRDSGGQYRYHPLPAGSADRGAAPPAAGRGAAARSPGSALARRARSRRWRRCGARPRRVTGTSHRARWRKSE